VVVLACAATLVRIAAANPGGGPGGTYRQPRVLGRGIADAAQMGRQPLILALGLAATVTVSLAAALLASVRWRRPRHALLKALGLTRGQVRATVAAQASVILVAALAVGVPLGIAAGRWAWAAFAGSLGVAPVTVVPGLALVAGAGGLLLAGNLLAAIPATVAARTRPAALLRAG
jgi:predicted lysophospholipase L1 biosynthesis ABC-type transport system permease subunit